MIDEPILSTRDRPGEFDAIESAKPGEPIFTLQGGDPHAPATILHWAHLARTAGRKETNKHLYDKAMRKASHAEQVAWAFSEYQRDPDNFAQATEHKRFDSEDLTDRNVILARAADRLNNALAEAVIVAEWLETLDESLLTVIAARIRDAADTLKDVSETIEPRRHMRRELRIAKSD